MDKTVVEYLGEEEKDKEYVVSENNHLTLILIALKSAQYQTRVKLVGKGASADIFGIVVGSKDHVVRINTLQDHQAPSTTSNLLIKSALSDRSQLHYEGFINVRKKAQLTNAYQRNENLMLSPEAKVETKPALEIIANDVRCTHSATIGKVDSEQLFYLQSRGLSVQLATTLIVSGFFQSILDKIEDKTLREEILKNINNKT